MIDLTAARATAETTLADTVVVTRAGGDATLDRTTGQLVTPTPVEVWTGPGSVTLGAATLRTDYGADRTLTTCEIRVPVSAVGIRPGDVVTVTAVHDEGDPQLLDAPMVVSVVDGRTMIVLRRLTATLVVEDTEAVIR